MYFKGNQSSNVSGCSSSATMAASVSAVAPLTTDSALVKSMCLLKVFGGEPDEYFMINITIELQ